MVKQIQLMGAERFVALLLIVFSVAELYAAMKLSLTEEFTLGPGALPVIYAVGLLIFAGMMAAWPSQKAPAAIDSSAVSKQEAVPPRNYRDGILTFSFVVAFIIAIYFVGFLGGTMIFSLLYVVFIAKWPILKSVPFALIWGGSVYYGFDHLLGVQLEPGILFGG